MKARTIVAMALTLALTAPAMAQSSGTITVHNAGSVPLSDVRVSPDYATRWGFDQLGGATLLPGEQMEVEVDRSGGACFFDVQATDVDGNSREFWGFNACSERTLDVQRALVVIEIGKRG